MKAEQLWVRTFLPLFLTPLFLLMAVSGTATALLVLLFAILGGQSVYFFVHTYRWWKAQT